MLLTQAGSRASRKDLIWQEIMKIFFPKTVQKVSEHNSKMPNLQNVRECLLFGFEENLLNNEEFILLYDMNILKYPDFLYWQMTFMTSVKLNFTF